MEVFSYHWARGGVAKALEVPVSQPRGKEEPRARSLPSSARQRGGGPTLGGFLEEVGRDPWRLSCLRLQALSRSPGACEFWGMQRSFFYGPQPPLVPCEPDACIGCVGASPASATRPGDRRGLSLLPQLCPSSVRTPDRSVWVSRGSAACRGCAGDGRGREGGEVTPCPRWVGRRGHGDEAHRSTFRLLDPCKPKGLWLNITRGMASAGAGMFFWLQHPPFFSGKPADGGPAASAPAAGSRKGVFLGK